MKRSIVLALTFALICSAALPAPAYAQGKSKKKIVGWTLIAAGSGLVIGAFNYDTHCPAGYSTHTIHTSGVNETMCVSVTSFGSDVRDPVTDTEYARPALLWSGIGSAVVGTVLLLLPKRVQQTTSKVTDGLTVTPLPNGWMAAKRFEF